MLLSLSMYGFKLLMSKHAWLARQFIFMKREWKQYKRVSNNHDNLILLEFRCLQIVHKVYLTFEKLLIHRADLHIFILFHSFSLFIIILIIALNHAKQFIIFNLPVVMFVVNLPMCFRLTSICEKSITLSNNADKFP